MKRSEVIVVSEKILRTIDIKAFNIGRGNDGIILKAINNVLKDYKFTQTLDGLYNKEPGVYFTSEEENGHYFKAYADNFGNTYVYIVKSAYAYIQEY